MDASDGATFTTWNPTTDEPLAEIAFGSSVDVHQAAGLALWRPTDAIEASADGLGVHAPRHYTHVTNVWVRPG